MAKVIQTGRLAANGPLTEKCHQFLEAQLGYRKALLTTSCTSALELAALLLNIKSGDEVIVPSYAFVTTANAFASRGAKIVFADSKANHPNIDEDALEPLITSKTKAIVALHYGGEPCNMDAIMQLANKHSIMVVEDNAQGIGSTFKKAPLGGIGHLGAISFHETKNVHCGEGGAMLVNDETLDERASTLWDMGTDKAAYKAGKVKSYGWVDVGSSFYPSELNAAFLFAQLQQLDEVNQQRKISWDNYYLELKGLEFDGKLKLPMLKNKVEHNAHTFYVVTNSLKERDGLINHLAKNGIAASFHFQPLHKSKYFDGQHDGTEHKNAVLFGDCLVRLPLFYGLNRENVNHVSTLVKSFYNS